MLFMSVSHCSIAQFSDSINFVYSWLSLNSTVLPSPAGNMGKKNTHTRQYIGGYSPSSGFPTFVGMFWSYE